jgi:hypothetical protein
MIIMPLRHAYHYRHLAMSWWQCRHSSGFSSKEQQDAASTMPPPPPRCCPFHRLRRDVRNTAPSKVRWRN